MKGDGDIGSILDQVLVGLFRPCVGVCPGSAFADVKYGMVSELKIPSDLGRPLPIGIATFYLQCRRLVDSTFWVAGPATGTECLGTVGSILLWRYPLQVIRPVIMYVAVLVIDLVLRGWAGAVERLCNQSMHQSGELFPVYMDSYSQVSWQTCPGEYSTGKSGPPHNSSTNSALRAGFVHPFEAVDSLPNFLAHAPSLAEISRLSQEVAGT